MNIYFSRMHTVSIVAYILLWFLLSTSLSLYNKWLFGVHAFHFPLFTTAIHTLIQFCLSSLVLRYCLPHYAPRKLSWKELFLNVAPCALASGLDIGLSNSSLKTISLSFYTMVKSSVSFWVLLFAFFFGLERPTPRLGFVMVIISLGVFLMAMHEASFELTGFLEVLLASILGGLRISLTQILLSNASLTLDNPFATNMHLTPIMFAVLLPSSIAVESLGSISSSPFFSTRQMIMNSIGLLLGGGFLAFLMIIVEFQCIHLTSGLTISVASLFKEIITIIVSVALFNDVLTPINILGLIISLSGIAMFNYWKWEKMKTTMANSYIMNPLREDPEIWQDDTVAWYSDTTKESFFDENDEDYVDGVEDSSSPLGFARSRAHTAIPIHDD